MRRVLTMGLSFVFFAIATPVLAQVAVEGATDADFDERARVHFHSGADYYERGDYEDALREFSLAYEMSRRPELLYNLGSSYERLGRFAEAADHLERYLAAMPDVENRDLLTERAARMRERAAAAAAGEETAVEADVVPAPIEDAVAPPAGSPGPHPASFVVLGAGALGLIAFGVLGGLALAEDGTLATECGTACSPARASTLESLALGADISLGIGAALAATGLILVFTTTDSSPAAGSTAPSTTVRLELVPNGARVSGTF